MNREEYTFTFAYDQVQNFLRIKDRLEPDEYIVVKYIYLIDEENPRSHWLCCAEFHFPNWPEGILIGIDHALFLDRRTEYAPAFANFSTDDRFDGNRPARGSLPARQPLLKFFHGNSVVAQQKYPVAPIDMHRHPGAVDRNVLVVLLIQHREAAQAWRGFLVAQLRLLRANF